jgi:hypothetical protein
MSNTTGKKYGKACPTISGTKLSGTQIGAPCDVAEARIAAPRAIKNKMPTSAINR